MKKGELLNIKNADGEHLYYTGIVDKFTYNGQKCVFLATDLNDANTYARYTQQTLAFHGYYL